MEREPTKWLRVTRRNPCVICGRPDFCGYSENLRVAICMRSESSRPTKNGGWLHRLDEPLPPVYVKPPPAPAATMDWDAYFAECRAQTTPERLQGLSDSLGVSWASLRRLGASWDGGHDAFAFPMYSTGFEVIGARLRTNDGAKLSVRGSHSGLFVPDAYLPDTLTDIMIVEGPTDAAAGLDLGFYTIGRPSCSGSVEDTVALCRGLNVVILADFDAPKARPNGTTWKPGEQGAQALAQAMHKKAKSVKVTYPLQGKDLRAWLNKGCTPAMLATVVRNAPTWKKPTKT